MVSMRLCRKRWPACSVNALGQFYRSTAAWCVLCREVSTAVAGNVLRLNARSERRVRVEMDALI